MKFNFKNKNKNKGFTLVEILLVVGFIALASIGVYTIYDKVKVGNMANLEGRNLDTFRVGIKTLYGANSNYNAPTAISATVVNNARITPTAMVSGAASILNSFGGTVTIGPVNLGTGANNGFRITYQQIPGAVCIKLVTASGVQFDQVTVGGVVVKTFGTNTLDPAAAAVECNKDAGNGVPVLFDSL